MRVQLALAGVFLVVVTILATGALVMSEVRATLTQELQLRGLAVGRHLAGISGDFVLQGKALDLANFASGARENRDVLYVKIIDSQGVIRAASPSAGIEGMYFPPAQLKPLQDQENLIQRYDTGSQWVQDIMVPIQVDGQRVGKVNIGMDERAVESGLEKAQGRLLTAGGLVLSGALVLALLMSMAFARPIEKLTDAVQHLGEGLLDTRVKVDVGGPRELQRLEERFNLMAARVEALVNGVIQSLATALGEHDQVSPGHSERVARYSTRTARLLGLDGRQQEEIRLAASLIDIGHMGVPANLLHKVDPLTDEELRRLRTHSQIGARIIEPIPVLKPVVPLLMHHHERWDGRGYPLGLKSEAIPLGARVLAVADSFDAMLTEKRHRKARSQAEAVRELQRCAGQQFDPKVVEAFVAQLTQAG